MLFKIKQPLIGITLNQFKNFIAIATSHSLILNLLCQQNDYPNRHVTN